MPAAIGAHSVVVSLGVCLVTNKVFLVKSIFCPKSNNLGLSTVTPVLPNANLTVASNTLGAELYDSHPGNLAKLGTLPIVVLSRVSII